MFLSLSWRKYGKYVSCFIATSWQWRNFCCFFTHFCSIRTFLTSANDAKWTWINLAQKVVFWVQFCAGLTIFEHIWVFLFLWVWAQIEIKANFRLWQGTVCWRIVLNVRKTTPTQKRKREGAIFERHSIPSFSLFSPVSIYLQCEHFANRMEINYNRRQWQHISRMKLSFFFCASCIVFLILTWGKK